MRRLKKPAILASSAFVFLVTISLVSALIVGIMLGGLDTAEDAGIEKIRDLQESSSFFSKIVKANLDGFSKFLRFATSPFKMLGLDSFTGFAVLEPKEDKIKSNPNSVPMAPSTGTLDSSGGDDVEDAPETEDTNTVGETSAKFRGKKSSGGSGGNGYYYYPTEGDTTLGYFIKNLPEGMRLVLASDTSVDATTVGLSGTVDLLVGGGGTTGNYTGMITVQFTSNVSMEGTHTGTQKDDTGMSVLGNVTSGNIISKALLIPVVKDSGQVYVCPGVAALTDVTYTCDNKVKLGLGQTKDGMTLSKVTYDGEEYYLVSNITGTGGAEGSLPVLTDPSVDNLNGNTSSNFTFTVTYTDAENDLASEVEVEIGDNNFTLTEANTFDTDATDGKVYMATYPGSELGAGTFNFKFYASDDIGAIVDSSPVSGLSIEEIISYIISQLPASIVAKLANNLAVDVTLDNQTGLVNVALGAEGEGYIAIVKLNFSQNVDLSSLSLDIDTTEGLSVLGNSEGHPAIVERTLLIPKVDDRNQVFICPGADSLADVTPSCPNVVFINVGETVNGMTASVVNFGGANYFQVTGITGTGGGVVLASNVQTGAPERYYGSGGNINAMGGNITPSNLTVQSQTNAWQGYYGEVTGNLSLADASGDTMYAWTSVTIQGEVLVSLSSSVNWGSLVAQNDCTTGESITGTGSDRVNNTFTASTGPNVNTSIGFNSIVANSSCSTNTYTSSAASTGDAWEEFILSDGSNDVWATIINSNTAGFDGATHDFQVIVPANQSVLTYYFYVELG